jgi:hypothetical protein
MRCRKLSTAQPRTGNCRAASAVSEVSSQTGHESAAVSPRFLFCAARQMKWGSALQHFRADAGSREENPMKEKAFCV